VKTHEELLASGFARTPSGVYVHAQAGDLSPEMIELARNFDQSLIAILFEQRDRRKYIEHEWFHAEHFVAEPMIRAV